MAKFEIDFFEFAFLVEACIPPVPIARGMFFNNVLDKYYKKLTPDERAKLYGWVLRHPRFDITNESCAAFEARYNPNNQYIVTAIDDKEYETFKINDEYFTEFIPGNYNSRIDKKNIKKVTKLEYNG